MAHTESTEPTEARIVALACVGYAECFQPDGSKGEAPTRYESVGCDDGRFTSQKES